MYKCVQYYPSALLCVIFSLQCLNKIRYVHLLIASHKYVICNLLWCALCIICINCNLQCVKTPFSAYVLPPHPSVSCILLLHFYQPAWNVTDVRLDLCAPFSASDDKDCGARVAVKFAVKCLDSGLALKHVCLCSSWESHPIIFTLLKKLPPLLASLLCICICVCVCIWKNCLPCLQACSRRSFKAWHPHLKLVSPSPVRST